MNIVLTPEHKYIVDGVTLPSVTEVLAETGHIDKASYLQYAGDYYRTRGTYIHAACALSDEDALDWDALDPAYSSYVNVYRYAVRTDAAFREKRGMRVEWIRASLALSFAGTIDRYLPVTEHLIDIKTSKQKAGWWKVQLAAYRLLVGGDPRRSVLQIDGEQRRYRLLPYADDAIDTNTFLFALLEYHESRMNADEYADLILNVEYAQKRITDYVTNRHPRSDNQAQGRVSLGTGIEGSGVCLNASQPVGPEGDHPRGRRAQRVKWIGAGPPGQPDAKKRQLPRLYPLHRGEASSSGTGTPSPDSTREP